MGGILLRRAGARSARGLRGSAPATSSGEMPKRRNSCGRNARANPTSIRPPEMPSSMRDLARELERMVEHRQHRPGDEAHRLRALRHGSEKDDRVRAVAAIAGEVVLDGAERAGSPMFRLLPRSPAIPRSNRRHSCRCGRRREKTAPRIACGAVLLSRSRGSSAWSWARDEGNSGTIGPRTCQSIERGRACGPRLTAWGRDLRLQCNRSLPR